MRRSQLLVLVTAVSLAGFVILLAALTAAPVTALPYESPLEAPAEAMGQQLEVGEQLVSHLPNAVPEPSLPSLNKIQDQPLEPSVTLQIDVNYADDWVEVFTDGPATVVVTVTDGGEDPQETATVSVDETGYFFVGCEHWDSGNCPDIGPGDSVVAWVVGATAEITTVGSIQGEVDTDSNVVTGTLHANWLPNPTNVQCEIWTESGPVVGATADPNGGSFTCDFTGLWDLQKFDPIAVRYFEPDGDSVINMLLWPWSRVNYAHDWVAGDYNAGHTFWITVTDDIGGFKASNVTTSEPGLGWGADGYDTGVTPWSVEQPDIVPFDLVYITGDDGYTNTLEVGLISATIDLAANEISGTIEAPGFGVSLTVECHPWGAWEAGMNDVETKSSWAEPDGSVPFTCSWDPETEWDIQPGQDIGVIYTEPDGDQVSNVYREPAAHMMIDKWSEGNPGEGGNFQYQINYWNDGDLTAENVVITDTMEGMLYVGDTSPFSSATYPIPGGEAVVFVVGSVEPGEGGRFLIYGSVEVAAGETITNTAEIDTTTPGQGEDGTESVSTREVQPNDTHLDVGKHAWTGDPAPGETFVFGVNVCNNGETNSSEVLMEDVLQYPEIWTGWIDEFDPAGFVVFMGVFTREAGDLNDVF